MKCKKAAQLISDGALDSGGVVLEQLRKHAAACEDCSLELKLHDLLLEQVQEIGLCEVPLSLRNNILNAARVTAIDCSTARDLMSCELDNELSWAESDAVRAHIKSCSDCAYEYAALKATVYSVRDIEFDVTPDFLHSSILEKVQPNKKRLVPQWMAMRSRAMSLGAAVMTAVICGVVYINVAFMQPKPAPTTIYMGSMKYITPPTLGNLPKVPPETPITPDKVAVRTEKFVEKIDKDLNVAFDSIRVTAPGTVQMASSHKVIDTAKAVKTLFKKTKLNKPASDTTSFSVIPSAEDSKYQLKENEPVITNSKPEVVASVADSNVSNEYAGNDELHFNTAAAKVQDKNRLDAWLEKSKSLTEEAKLSRKSANIQFLRFRF